MKSDFLKQLEDLNRKPFRKPFVIPEIKNRVPYENIDNQMDFSILEFDDSDDEWMRDNAKMIRSIII